MRESVEPETMIIMAHIRSRHIAVVSTPPPKGLPPISHPHQFKRWGGLEAREGDETHTQTHKDGT